MRFGRIGRNIRVNFPLTEDGTESGKGDSLSGDGRRRMRTAAYSVTLEKRWGRESRKSAKTRKDGMTKPAFFRKFRSRCVGRRYRSRRIPANTDLRSGATCGGMQSSSIPAVSSYENTTRDGTMPSFFSFSKPESFSFPKHHGPDPPSERMSEKSSAYILAFT